MPETVRRVQFMDRGVDVNKKNAQLPALDAHFLLEAWIVARRRRLIPPTVGDRCGDVLSQRRADRLSVWAIFPQMDVEVCEVACKGAKARIKRIECALHFRQQKAQHQGGEGDENRNDQPDMINCLARPVSLPEPIVKKHPHASGAEQGDECG